MQYLRLKLDEGNFLKNWHHGSSPRRFIQKISASSLHVSPTNNTSALLYNISFTCIYLLAVQEEAAFQCCWILTNFFTHGPLFIQHTTFWLSPNQPLSTRDGGKADRIPLWRSKECEAKHRMQSRWDHHAVQVKLSTVQLASNRWSQIVLSGDAKTREKLSEVLINLPKSSKISTVV